MIILNGFFGKSDLLSVKRVDSNYQVILPLSGILTGSFLASHNIGYALFIDTVCWLDTFVDALVDCEAPGLRLVVSPKRSHGRQYDIKNRWLHQQRQKGLVLCRTSDTL